MVLLNAQRNSYTNIRLVQVVSQIGLISQIADYVEIVAHMQDLFCTFEFTRYNWSKLCRKEDCIYDHIMQ